ncbi:type I restriction endonuclease subunit R, partial [Vibrio splendidus]
DQRAAASEMEHAIRKHCKVKEGDDPIMYKRFSEKLEEVLKKYNDNWEQMVLALGGLRAEIDAGRGHESDSKGPFFDLITDITFAGVCPVELEKRVQAVVDEILNVLASDIRSLNFWERPAQVSELEGKLEEVFILSGVDELSDKQDQLVTEIVALAKRREQSILENATHEAEA